MKYNTLLAQASALLAEQPNNISLLANASAFLYQSIPNLNWVGFYLFDGKNLVVGPFQGKVACSIIPPKKGVCGTAFDLQTTQVVKDVHAIDNHIVCDPASQSEVVIPMFFDGDIMGVLDIDSPVIDRFDAELVNFLEQFSIILTNLIDK